MKVFKIRRKDSSGHVHKDKDQHPSCAPRKKKRFADMKPNQQMRYRTGNWLQFEVNMHQSEGDKWEIMS